MLAGQHTLVILLMAKTLIIKPPRPRCTFVWDAQVVLNFIEKDWGIYNSLTDQELGYKLSMLLSLTVASRVSCKIHGTG